MADFGCRFFGKRLGYSLTPPSQSSGTPLPEGEGKAHSNVLELT